MYQAEGRSKSHLLRSIDSNDCQGLQLSKSTAYLMPWTACCRADESDQDFSAGLQAGAEEARAKFSIMNGLNKQCARADSRLASE